MTEGGMNVSELMTKNNRRNWRRLLAGGLIAIVVLALLIAAIILLTGSPNSASSRTTTTSSITLEDWLWGSLSTKGFNGTWLNDDEIMYRDEFGNLMVHSIDRGSSRKLLAITHPALSSSFDHELSADQKYLLLASNYQKDVISSNMEIKILSVWKIEISHHMRSFDEFPDGIEYNYGKNKF